MMVHLTNDSAVLEFQLQIEINLLSDASLFIYLELRTTIKYSFTGFKDLIANHEIFNHKSVTNKMVEVYFDFVPKRHS